MQRLDITDITDIKIPRSHLQHPDPNGENPLNHLLDTEASLEWIGNTIDTIVKEGLTSYIITVDDQHELSDRETAMLQAAQLYISDHLKSLKETEKKVALLCNKAATVSSAFSAAAAAAVDCALGTEVDHAVPTPTTSAPNTTASSSNPVIQMTALTPDADTYTSAQPDEDDRDSQADEEPGEALLLKHAADNNKLADDAVMATINQLLNLTIWNSKGRGFLSYSKPDGIKAMLKLEQPTLPDYCKIASERYSKTIVESASRTGMTNRFYQMLIDLDKPGMTAATRQERLKKHALDELINNDKIHGSWQIGKVLLAEKDLTTLCGIACIPLGAIEELAKAATVDVDAAPRTRLFP